MVGFNDCVPLCETSCTNLHLGVKLVYRIVFPLLSSVFHSSMYAVEILNLYLLESIVAAHCVQESLLSLIMFEYFSCGYDMLLTHCALLFN